MKKYFSGDSKAALKTSENEVDYEQEADQNCCLAATEAFTIRRSGFLQQMISGDQAVLTPA